MGLGPGHADPAGRNAGSPLSTHIPPAFPPGQQCSLHPPGHGAECHVQTHRHHKQHPPSTPFPLTVCALGAEQVRLEQLSTIYQNPIWFDLD